MILCVAMQARRDAVEVGRVFGVNLGADGFFLEEHPKLGPLEYCYGRGLSGRGLSRLPRIFRIRFPRHPEQPSKPCHWPLVERSKCPPSYRGSIRICVPGARPASGFVRIRAIEFNERHAVSVVNEALCKGCGSCAGFCPSGAAQVKHFNRSRYLQNSTGSLIR